jgi:hypothetical protein
MVAGAAWLRAFPRFGLWRAVLAWRPGGRLFGWLLAVGVLVGRLRPLRWLFGGGGA